MTEILEFWRNGSRLKKTLAAIGFLAFLAGVAIKAKEFYGYFLEPDPVPSLNLDFAGLKSGEEFENFLNTNNGKIVDLRLIYNYNLFITSSLESGNGSILTIYSEKPAVKFFYFCYPEGVTEIDRNGVHARLGPIACLEDQLELAGDPDKYRFNRTAGTYYLEGHFFIEFTHMAQGHKFYNLKAIHPGEMANYIVGHQ